MRMLILTSYYIPDLGAGSFRIQALIKELRVYSKKGLEIDLITTLPNRYNSLKLEAPIEEDFGWLRIYRIKLPSHKSGMIDQSMAYIKFVKGVRKFVHNRTWDLVFATSSRLMTAVLAASIARRIKSPYYLDIRDLFTDSLNDLFAGNPAKLLLSALRFLEKRTFRNASKINIVSAGFLPHVKKIAPNVEVKIFTNGIDDMFLRQTTWCHPNTTKLPIILYAGNIGDGQGLHGILPQAASMLTGIATIRIIGDGGKRLKLQQAISEAGVSNIEILAPIPRSELLLHYKQASILFLHLNDFSCYERVLPSKIFEYGATGKPILAGVGGYAAKFIDKEIRNAALFSPLDVAGMVSATSQLLAKKESKDTERFKTKYSRNKIMKAMATDIVSLLK